MAKIATDALKSSIECLGTYDKAKASAIREAEDKTDHLEDVIGSYLVKTADEISNPHWRFTLTLSPKKRLWIKNSYPHEAAEKSAAFNVHGKLLKCTPEYGIIYI